MSDSDNINDETDMDATTYNIKALTDEAVRGNKAYGHLREHAGSDWARWQLAIEGLAALRDIVFAKIGERNMRSQNYRNTMETLLSSRKYNAYSLMSRQERSVCYQLADNIEAVAIWHAGLDAEQKLRWVHPATIVKHIKPELLSKDPRHNQPKPKSKSSKVKKRRVDPEADRLKDILIEVVQYLMTPGRDQASDADFAMKLMERIKRPGEPDDSLDGAFDDEEAADD